MPTNMSNEFSGGIETLEVWKASRIFRNKINDLVQSFSEEEKYLLRYQLLKSSRAIGTAIAKGYGRHQCNEMIDFCRKAREYLLETLDHLYTAVDEKYISEQTLNLFKKEYEHLLKLVNGYIGYLKKQEEIITNEWMDDLDMVMEEDAGYGKRFLG
jgi:four helix bundle protein